MDVDCEIFVIFLVCLSYTRWPMQRSLITAVRWVVSSMGLMSHVTTLVGYHSVPNGPCCNRRIGYLLPVVVWPDASDTTTISRRVFVVFPALNFDKKGSVIGSFTDPLVNMVKNKLCGPFHTDIW